MDPGILSRTVRVWTGITPPGQEAPKGRAISAASAGVLSEGIHRELRPEPVPEALHAHPPEDRIINLHQGRPAAGRPQEAGSKGEDPGVEASEVPLEGEALEARPEVVSAAAGLPADFGINANALNSLTPCIVIASPKGVAISFFTGLLRHPAKRGTLQ